MKITKAGIEIIEDDDPVEGESFEEAIGDVIGKFRRNINRIAETLDSIQDQIDEMKGEKHENADCNSDA